MAQRVQPVRLVLRELPARQDLVEEPQEPQVRPVLQVRPDRAAERQALPGPLGQQVLQAGLVRQVPMV